MEKNYTNLELWKRFLPYFSKYKRFVILDLFCAGLTTVNELALPVILRFMTNTAMNNLESMTMNLILKISLLYIVLKIVDVSANYYMAKIGHITGAYIEKDMRKDIFSHLQNLSDSFYSKNKVGKLMSRITNDLFDVTEFSHHCPEEYFIGTIKITIAFVILWRINIPLTLMVFSMIPLMLYFTNKVNRRVRKTFYAQRSQIGHLNSGIEDSLLGVKVVKSFTNEEYEIEKFEEYNEEFLDIKKATYQNLASFHTISRIFDALMHVIVILFGGIFLIKEMILPGDMVAYILYISTLTSTVRRIVEFTETFHKGMSGIEKFVEIMDTGVEIFDEEDAVELKDVKGEIKFENVSFKYDKDEEFVLKNISFEVKPGENIAFVGPSGGGKTTIINLIPRFYDVTEGSIAFDGIDIKKIKLKSLRNNIGIVQQDVYLFSDTVFENIRYGKPDATTEEVMNAAKLAGADEFISELPNGYQTYVGERGMRLSGGQKQRISIARVFLKNPPVLILDEATSALDNKSENLIQESLDKLASGRTTITIAHRLSTIINADEILVLTKDGIVERGNHDELLKQNGIYADLYKQGLKKDAITTS